MSEAVLVEIAGRKLETQHITVSRPQGTIVLLHEALGSVSHWRDFPQRLAERCQMDVLLYSRLGHGWSEGPPESRSRRYFEQQSLTVLPALLAHFAIDRPVLLGHSEGAAIALVYTAQQAVHHPEKVRALILESPILHIEPAAGIGMAMAERAWRETDFRERLARHHRDPDAVFAAWLSIRESDSMLTLPLEAHLPPVRCPLLVIEGEHDEYATTRQTDALRPLAPQMQVVHLPDSGHTPHREQPEVVLDQIAAFLHGLPAQPPAIS
ncbi:MAG TPA: alpha/beta hydrolase [Acidobacteriaceae bacterium]|jgi:pimeloyl-ACP methyl ester carboxylesterase